MVYFSHLLPLLTYKGLSMLPYANVGQGSINPRERQKVLQSPSNKSVGDMSRLSTTGTSSVSRQYVYFVHLISSNTYYVLCKFLEYKFFTLFPT